MIDLEYLLNLFIIVFDDYFRTCNNKKKITNCFNNINNTLLIQNIETNSRKLKPLTQCITCSLNVSLIQINTENQGKMNRKGPYGTCIGTKDIISLF